MDLPTMHLHMHCQYRGNIFNSMYILNNSKIQIKMATYMDNTVPMLFHLRIQWVDQRDQ